jgi:hypothetical protein
MPRRSLLEPIAVPLVPQWTRWLPAFLLMLLLPGVARAAVPFDSIPLSDWRYTTERPSDFEPPEEGRSLLHFQAVDYAADVWLNGKHLGWHVSQVGRKSRIVAGANCH